MITFPSGLKFGKGEDSLVNSLFTSESTNDGWYTITGRKYKTMRFFTGNGKPLFYIVNNAHGVTSGSLSKLNGEFFYSHGFSSTDEKRLGLSDTLYSRKKQIFEQIIGEADYNCD